MTGGFKVFYAGEFGIAPTKMFEDLLDEVIADGTTGALIWSLRPHNKDGGYYKHNEGSTTFYSYHWPGFPENQGYDELAVVNLMKAKAYRIQTRVPPPIPVPEVPTMLSSSSVLSLNWRGSVGGRSYDIARAVNKDGEWTVVGTSISDCKQIEKEGPLFRDSTAQPGTQYYYRVRAKNEAGLSGWSNIIGPIKT